MATRDRDRFRKYESGASKARKRNLREEFDKTQAGALPEGIKSAKQCLQYIWSIRDSFPNTAIAYRILLTVPVTVASAERSFSKIKLIKNYFRSTMSQDRLCGLSILSLEKGIASN